MTPERLTELEEQAALWDANGYFEEDTATVLAHSIPELVAEVRRLQALQPVRFVDFEDSDEIAW